MDTTWAEDRFIAAMGEAVRERGYDWVYPRDDKSWSPFPGRCQYVREGDQPACLIGLALHKFGAPIEFLQENEGAPAATLLGLVGDISTWVMAAAGNAQSWQDDGAPWGDALGIFWATLLEVE